MKSLKAVVLAGVVLAVVGLLAVGSASADVIAPSADVTIYKDANAWSDPPSDTPGVGNFGAGNSLCIYDIDYTDGAGVRSTQRTLIQFDLSAYSAGSIQSAVLKFYVGAVDQSGHVLAYRVTQSWVEGTGTSGDTTDGADWFTFDGSSSWGTAGGDYNSTVIADTVVSTSGQWYSLDITSLVQNWVNGTQSNFGLILVSGDPTGADTSGENGNTGIYDIPSSEGAANQPYLEITAIPEPVTMSLLAVGGIAALLRRRKA
jgi:hypothetical protein